MTESDVLKATAPRTTFRLATSVKTLRSNVSWIPTPSQIQKNATDCISGLKAYRQTIGVTSNVGQKNMIRRRAKSLFIAKTDQSIKNDNKSTMDDLHIEFNKKYNSPNHGLKPSADRQLPKMQPQLTDCRKIFDELQAKLMVKRAPRPPPFPTPNVKMSWNQLKLLQVKRYPVVQANSQVKRLCVYPAKPRLVTEKLNQTLKELCKYVCAFYCI